MTVYHWADAGKGVYSVGSTNRDLASESLLEPHCLSHGGIAIPLCCALQRCFPFRPVSTPHCHQQSLIVSPDV